MCRTLTGPAAPAAGASTLTTAYFVLALARALAVPIPSELITSVAGRLRSPGTTATDDPVLLFGIGELIGFPTPATVLGALEQTADAAHHPSSSKALRQWLASIATGDPRLKGAAAATTQPLRSGDGFRALPGAPYTDLLSTTIGLLITAPAVASRIEALHPFDGVGGTSLLPVQVATGNVRSPFSVYLGYLALGQVTDTAGLLGQPFATQ